MEEFDNSLNETIEDVNKELIVLQPDLGALAFDTPLSRELVLKFCKKFNLTPDKCFLNNMTTPFALAKYLLLTIDEKSLIEELEPLLTDTFKDTDILFTFEKNFSNCIVFSRIANIDKGIKAEDLRVKFYKDYETEAFKYRIFSGFWGLDIEFNQLVNLLLHKKVQVNVGQNKASEKTEFKVIVDNVEINVKKLK